jgi:CRISPR-associated protein Csm4
MLKSVVLRCRPGVQFHFGKIALDENTSLNDTDVWLRSDALASALIDLAFRIADEPYARQVLDDFRQGAVKISSLFYCLDVRGQMVYLLPKPVSLETTRTPNPKQAAKVAFVSKGVWEQGLLPKDWEQQGVIVDKKIAMLRQELSGLTDAQIAAIKIYEEITLPKVQVHKPAREGGIYYHTNIQIPRLEHYVAKGLSVHSYCLIQSDDEALLNRTHALLGILADEGIGGERTVGCGALLGADPMQDFSLLDGQSSSACALGSLCLPADQPELDAFTHYKVITRGGRKTADHGALKRIKMLAEGAVMRQPVNGDARILLPHTDRNYWRIGTALCLPLHPNYAK